MNVILDCDDVLLDWIGGFWTFCEEKTGNRLDRRGPMGWCMADWIGVDPNEAIELIKEFNTSDRFGELHATPGAVSAVRAMSNDYELHVLTSCSSDAKTVALREDNLKSEFGDIFASITCLDLGQPKSAELAKHPQSFWIEDNVKNALMGTYHGHETFVRRMHHNRQQEVNKDCRWQVTWFSEWSEVLAALPH